MASALISKATEPSLDELLGSNNWKGLIEPDFNLSLRKFILRCGEFCEATYDSFNSTKESPNCGNSDFGKTDFFNGVMLKEKSRYKVVSFIYATAGIQSIFNQTLFLHSLVLGAWDQESNWFGYVAVSNDQASKELGRREVYVAWRGTITTAEWGSNIFGANPVAASPLFSPTSSTQKSTGLLANLGKQEAMIHSGWHKIYTTQNSLSVYVKSSAREQLHHAIKAIRDKYNTEKLSIIVTGHSLGGSLATLSAFDLAENNVAGNGVTITAIIFAGPQVGNDAFKSRVKSIPNLKILQVNNNWDGVPKMPDSVLPIYVPISTAELKIDSTKSPNLFSKFPTEVLMDFHNLEANLHVVAGWNGAWKPFEMKVKRSLSLVNKSSRYLQSSLKVPEYWWTKLNKGMKYDEANDEWVFDKPPPADQMIGVSL